MHIEDRGFQFADGVYEVWAVFGGALADAEGHFERLERCLGELRIAAPMGRRGAAAWCCTRRCAATGCATGWSICRSPAASRRATTPSRTRRCRPAWSSPPGASIAPPPRRGPSEGVGGDHRAGDPLGALRHQDGRPAAQRAGQAGRRARPGAVEAWFVDELGLVTEGASTNAWIVDADGALRTRDTQANILRGITRKTLLDDLAARGSEGGGAAVHRWRRPRRRGSLHHGRRHPACCPSSASTARRWATASPVRWRTAAAALYRRGAANGAAKRSAASRATWA